MINPIDLEENKRYVCKSDRKDKQPTTWLFRPLLISQELYINKLGSELKDSTTEKRVEISLNLLHIGLIGAENYKGKWKRDESADDVLPGIKPWSEATLSAIPAEARFELATYIIGGYTELTEEEAKN